MLQPVHHLASLLPRFRSELADAERLLDSVSAVAFKPCPEPRHLFSQLGPEQQVYYLLFRRHFLTGKALVGDRGYLTLLAQEIIHGTIELKDPVMSLFRLVYHYAPTDANIREHGTDWVLTLNALHGAPHDPGPLAAFLTQPTKRAPHPELALDGVLTTVMADGNLERVNFGALIGLSRQGLPLAEFTSDMSFLADVTRLAVASFFSTHVQPGLLPDQNTFTYWVRGQERLLHLEPFPGLLHDQPRRRVQVATHHVYKPETLPALRDAVSDVHKYALYLARASEEPVAPDATALQVRADAHRPLMALVDERLPDDLRRRAILFERSRGDSYAFTMDDLLAHRRSRHSLYEPPAQRYQRARAAHLKHLDARREDRPQFHPSHAFVTARDLLDLNQRDQRYFTYWRTHWREGKTFAASPLILSAYAAEVVNLWGFDSPQAAYDDLARLADAYAQQLPGQLKDWLVDFARVYEVSDTPNQAELRTFQGPTGYGNVTAAILGWLETRDYSRIDHKLIRALSDYDPTSGTFYERTQRRERFDEALTLVIQAVSAHFEDRHGVDVFDHYLPREKWGDYHQQYGRWSRLFNNLTHDPALKPTRILHTTDHQRIDRLRRMLGNALKYTENTFRKEEKIAGRRQVSNMHGWTKELRDLIDATLESLLAPPKPKPQVRVDAARLAQLERDSQSVRERLIDPSVFAEAEREAREATAATPGGESPALVTVTAGVDASEYHALLAELGPGEKRALALVAEGAPREALEGVARELGTPVDLLLDTINERALDTLADNVIDAYENPPSIIDEHQAGVRQALQEGDQ